MVIRKCIRKRITILRPGSSNAAPRPLWPTSDVSEIYVSTDVETDGPIPGPHSMLSFGSAAYQADKKLVGTFAANLDTLPGSAGDPKTMAWWKEQPAAWTDCRRDPQSPETAMRNYLLWVKAL